MEIDLTDSGQMMKVVRQNFCMHLERGKCQWQKQWRIGDSFRAFRECGDGKESGWSTKEREEVLVQQILAFLYTGFGKGAERGGGGKGETPHGSWGHPPLFFSKHTKGIGGISDVKLRFVFPFCFYVLNLDFCYCRWILVMWSIFSHIFMCVTLEVQ